MAFFRTEKSKNHPFAIVDKFFINDERLSWKAKGLMVYFLSLPDDWKIYEVELSKHCGDGLRSTRSGIKELIDAGYIIRQKKRSSGRFSGYEYTVYEHPTVMPKCVNGKRVNGKQHTTNNDLTNNDLTNHNDNGFLLPKKTALSLNDIENLQDEGARTIISYYFEQYKLIFKEEHPRLKKAQLARIAGVLICFMRENDISPVDIGALIDRHFERDSLQTDYNLNHFGTEGILQNLFWEVLY